MSAAGLPQSTGAATAVVVRLAFMLVDAAALRRRAGVVATDDGARGS